MCHSSGGPEAEQPGAGDAAGRAADFGVRMRSPAGPAQVARELRGVIRGAGRRRARPAASVGLERLPEGRPERDREIRRRVPDGTTALAEQRRRLYPHAVAVNPRRRFRARHERREERTLARRELVPLARRELVMLALRGLVPLPRSELVVLVLRGLVPLACFRFVPLRCCRFAPRGGVARVRAPVRLASPGCH
jgi:hypothetical protein